MKKLYLILLIAIPGALFAQKEDKNKEVEQIIITKKGVGDEKLNIIVDGEKVTVNGSPIDKEKEADITVQRRKIKDMDVFLETVPGRKVRTITITPGTPMHPSMAPMAPIAPNKAMLGVSTQKGEEGAEIINITEGSAAEKVGLKEGDVITEVDHKKIASPDELSKALKDKEPGNKVTIAYLRDRKQYTAVAELTAWKAPESFSWNGQMAPGQNLQIEEIFKDFPLQNGPNREMLFLNTPTVSGPKIGIRVQDGEFDGVKIIDVLNGSDAEKSGLKEGDVIKEVNNMVVQSTDDVVKGVRGMRAKKSIPFKVIRNGKAININVNLSKKSKTADL